MNVSTLLVLTDFFQAASLALEYATNLAAPLRAQLVLLHVHRDSLLDPEALAGETAHQSTPAARLALDSLTHKLPVPVVTEVGHGRVLPAVADAVSRHHPTLVVLSRPDWDELPDELNTTTALDILQEAPYPMLVVPPAVASTSPPRRLLLAADGEPFALGDFGPAAGEVLRAVQADITVLNCSPQRGLSADAALESVLQSGLTAALAPPRSRHVVADDPAEAILAAARPADFDAVVLLARRRSVLGRLFHRSVTAHVLLHSKIPVLVLPVQ